MRLCTKCNEERPADAFYMHGGHLSKICKDCEIAYATAWAKQNPEAKRKADQNYIEKHHDEVRARQRARYREKKLLYPERYKEYARRARERRREKIQAYQKIYHKKRRILEYGISIEQYEALLQSQDAKCAICELPFVDTPHIDHDHACCSGRDACGKCVRGLTCGDCNKLLGMAKDNPEVLRKAASYLERNQSKAA